MKKTRFLELASKYVSYIITAIIPMVFQRIAIVSWSGDSNDTLGFEKYMSTWTIVGASVILLVLIVSDQIKPCIPWLRPMCKYEGKWLQIIPDMKDRPYSIIELEYNKKMQKYEMYGCNFYKNIDDGAVIFNAYRFVERTHCDGFYYITDSTEEHKNGLGKIAFIRSHYDQLTRAVGYFFDSSSEEKSVKYRTIIIKCDKALVSYLNEQNPNKKLQGFENMTAAQIAKECKVLADKEIEIYQKKKSDDIKCRCIHCALN